MTGLIHEIFAGSLTPDSLDDHIRNDPSIIDKPGGHRNLTPLCTAVIAANLDAVELLLCYQADPNGVSLTDARTPLQFATSRKLRANQAAIVSALLRADSDVNRSDSSRGNNTPLINAIVQLRDKTIVQLLVDHGADVKHTNSRGKSAEELAKIYGMERSLRPRTERTAVMGYFIDLLVALVMFILALVDNGAIEGAVKGAINKLYHITGAKNISATDQLVFENLGQRVDSQDPSGLSTSGNDWVNKIVSHSSVSPSASSLSIVSIPNDAPISEAKVEQAIDDFLEDNDLTMFFRPGDDFLKDLARRATALSRDINTIYTNPDNVKRITNLSLYQPVIYCDDSSSMSTDSRYHHQTELVTRIARIATKILPDTDDCRVELRFINDGCASRLSAEEIASTMRRVRPNNVTRIGTNLRLKILEPLVYRYLGPGRRLNRPILICTITDGCPVEEPEGTFRDAIIECREKLVTNGYESTAVKFLVNHVGNDPQAERFLARLRGDDLTRDMVYCTSDRLDEKFKELKAAEDRLEEWLLKTLTSPIMSGD